MDSALITGAGGLVGSQAVEFFSQKSFEVVGIDNDMRKTFFGQEASTAWNIARLQNEYPSFSNHAVDIRDQAAVFDLFNKYGCDIKIVIHTAAQLSHDWAATDPRTDFEINADGTLNVLEASRKYCPEAVILFTSTNNVYGDLPNYLPLIEKETRWELPKGHPYYEGIDESMSIDQAKHSLFGASNIAVDMLVQEYGRYFGMKTVCFRGGCLTGPNHAGTMLHGFLSYLMKCCVTGGTYTIFGYKGKQVRDNIHSYDFVNAIYHFYCDPKQAAIYNMGGGRFSNCSILEAIDMCEKITGEKLNTAYCDQSRAGDHIWYISNLTKFITDYPGWKIKFGLENTLLQIYEAQTANIDILR